MKITEISTTDEDYRSHLEIIIDSEYVVDMCDGAPEDNTLSRNFNDAWNISSLMQRMYEAGKRGEKVTYESISVRDGEESRDNEEW